MKKLKIILCGQKSFGAAVFHALREKTDHAVAAVYAPAGDKLYEHARLCGVPAREAGTLNSKTMPQGCDLLIAAHSHDFISERVRNRLALGAIGYHPSMLPRHRGRDAVRWAVKMGDAITGGTVYWLNNSVDGGDIAAQEPVFIRPGDTATELWRRELFPLGVRLLLQTVSDISGGAMRRREQDEALATWEPSFEPPRLVRPELRQLPGPGAPHPWAEIFLSE